MTDFRWTKAFEFSHAPAEVWRGYIDMEIRTEPEAGQVFIMNDFAGSRIEFTEVTSEQLLTYTEERPGVRCTTTVTFETCDGGTRVTITKSGFGEIDDFDVFGESNLLGYTEGMADLAVYLDTGVMRHRHLVNDRCSTGVTWKQTFGGLVVRAVGGGLGPQADLQPGDLLLSINGAAIYERNELWFLTRWLEPGTEVEVAFVRDGVALTGRGRMQPLASWTIGELGGGPRVEESV